jgi:uncharacterized protein (DUF1697 family)
MALVVFLKGVNVGGHRTFRPSVLAKELRRYDTVNIGAAGTFVVRESVSRAALRAQILRRLPFVADVMMCSGSDILRLASSDPFAGQPSGRHVIQFVSILAKRRLPASPIPLSLPPRGRWCVRTLALQGRFVLGLYRREMQAIGHLGQLERIFGVPVATRNWNTILAISRVLAGDDAKRYRGRVGAGDRTGGGARIRLR